MIGGRAPNAAHLPPVLLGCFIYLGVSESHSGCAASPGWYLSSLVPGFANFPSKSPCSLGLLDPWPAPAAAAQRPPERGLLPRHAVRTSVTIRRALAMSHP